MLSQLMPAHFCAEHRNVFSISDGEHSRCQGHFEKPYQKTWASLVAQLVKNPPAMQETLVQFLGWEDPLEKG